MAIATLFLKEPTRGAIYPLSLHDALPISGDPFCRDLQLSGPARDLLALCDGTRRAAGRGAPTDPERGRRDRKSTRLNSSHITISYAALCLKKKTKHQHRPSDLRA